ncbi:MAG: sensor histidine kinase, partial [Blastocatellia bacterium]
IDPAVAAAQIPPLILQPLVENAVKHGIAPKREGGRLGIRAFSEDDHLFLVVEDDGVGWNEASSGGGSSNGVGLRNVRERLQAFYETRATLEIHSAPGRGTRISIEIPKYETQSTDRGRRSLGALAAEEAHRRAS